MDTKARVELACRVLQTLPWPSGSFVVAAPPGVDPRSRGSEPRALPLSYGASNGAHGRSRTRIFRPVTFVLLRRQEGYVCMEEPACIDPAPPR